ncbi:MAG: peroxiredoxin family protein [Polyangiaceae bacterium]
MKRTIRILATIAAAVGLAYAIDAQAGGADLLGKRPPPIKAAGWLNTTGAPTLAALKGKVAVVEFWATWCPPCRRSVPRLIEMRRSHAGADLVIIGLSDEPKARVEDFAKKMGMNYIVGYGSESGIDYGVDTIPRVFVVGKDGKVAWTGNPLDRPFEGEVERALAAK